MKRREFLRCAGYSTGGIALGCVALGSTCDSLSTVTEPLVRTPLSLPDTVRGTGLLTASDGASVGLGDGRQGSGWGYGGALPGPTVRVRRGDHVDLRLRNNLGQETTVHWHGLVVPSAMDGHPRDAVPPGGDYRYEYVVDQRAGLNWYHPHPHHLVGEQVAKGLSGLFIIEDDEEASLELPSRPREVPLVIRDARVGLDDQLEYRRRAEGFRGDFPLVNGTAYPALDVESAVYRFRILNGSNTRVFHLGLSTGDPLTVIGNDGGLLPAPARLTAIELGPAERLDVLVDLRLLAVGQSLALRCTRTGWDLLVMEVVRAVEDSLRIPVELPQTGSLVGEAVARERTFRFQGHDRINGKRYDIDRVDFRVPRGHTELWRFVSEGGAPHPVHVHGTHFQVVSRTGGRGKVRPWEHGWKDTVLVQDQETVEVLVRFDAFAGLYLLHCHRLEHEDGGMMMNFVVTPGP